MPSNEQMSSLQSVEERGTSLRETPKPPRKSKPRKLKSMVSVTAITSIFQRRRSSLVKKTSLAGSRTASTSSAAKTSFVGSRTASNSTCCDESLLERDQGQGKSSNSMSSASSSPMMLPSPSPKPANQPSKRPDQPDQPTQAEQLQLNSTPTATDEEPIEPRNIQPHPQLQLEQKRAPPWYMMGAYREPAQPLQENIDAEVGRRMSEIQRQPHRRMTDAIRSIEPGKPVIVKSQTMGVLPTRSSIPMATKRRGSMLPLPTSGNRNHSEPRSDDPRMVSPVTLLYHCLFEGSLIERDISLEGNQSLQGCC